MLELPAEEISPERNRPTDRRNFRGRHRHRHSGSLVFLLPDRATSHSDSCETASYRLMRTDRTALIRIGETIKRHLSGGYLVHWAAQRSNFRRHLSMIADIFLMPSRT